MEYSFKTLDEFDEVSEDLVRRYNELILQLTSKDISVTRDALEEVRKRKNSEMLLFMLDASGEISGMAQGTYHCVPIHCSVYVNAVVVDQVHRGKGYGTILMLELEKRAKERWSTVESFDLTSSPKRGAESFYLKLGYKMRTKESGDETVVYVKEAA